MSKATKSDAAEPTIQLSLSGEVLTQMEAAQKFSAEKDLSREDFVAGVALFLLETYSAGGMMLKPEHVRAIQDKVGLIRTGDDVVSGVRKLVEAVLLSASAPAAAPVPIKDKFSATVRLDPAIHDAAVENARMMGYTIEQFMDEMLNTITTSGWLYGWQPTGLTVHFSDSERAMLEKLAGTKLPKATDIIRILAAREVVVAA